MPRRRSGPRLRVREDSVGYGPTGITINNSVTVVTNLQGGTLSRIDLTIRSVALPPGTRPYDVAIAAANKAVVTTPMVNGILIVDLRSGAVTPVETGVASAMGAGAIATAANLAYAANQISAGVTVVDVAAGNVTRTFAGDPGPRAPAVNPAKNQ